MGTLSLRFEVVLDVPCPDPHHTRAVMEHYKRSVELGIWSRVPQGVAPPEVTLLMWEHRDESGATPLPVPD